MLCMDTCQTFRHHFLIAMPGLRGGVFADSLTYICEHSESGAMGLVINHTLELTLDDMFEHLNLQTRRRHDQFVLAGGPVQTERGFVLHRRNGGHGEGREWESSMVIAEDIRVTSSIDILAAMAADEGPDEALVALGYAGWSAGQLEQELAANAWLTLPADELIMFGTPPEQRLHAAGRKLGVDLNLIHHQIGHA